GHFLTVTLLHLPHDATGALRVYQLGAIPEELFDRVRSYGYSFFFESLFVLYRNGFAIEEMPIALPARTYGSSKMSLRETVRSAWRLLKLYWAAVRCPESFLLTSPLPPILAAEMSLQDPQGWDTYWTRGHEKSRAGRWSSSGLTGARPVFSCSGSFIVSSISSAARVDHKCVCTRLRSPCSNHAIRREK